MLEEFEILENIANNFDTMGKNQEYMKEQITNFDSKDKIKINFKFCHVTISKNGGLMAICKKKGFLDMSRNSIINRNIIVMHQDANYRYYIPISWNYNKRYIVCIDFTPKDELYAILNDGGIFKIKYYERTYKEILTSQYLKEGVLKAKLFEKGFIALTQSGNFYYIKDIKNPVASTLINLGLLIKELNPKIIESIEFVGISSENSSSKRFELIITNPEKNGGVFKFIDRGEGNNLQVDIVNNYREIIGGSYILTEKPQRLLLSIKSDECKIIEEKEKKKKKKRKGKQNRK